MKATEADRSAWLLFMVFLVLELTDQIDWAWYWVASPLWIPFVAIVGFTLLQCVALDLVVQPLRYRRALAAFRQRNGIPKL